MKNFASIPDALRDCADGKMLIVVDDESRENEGDFIIPAQNATAVTINFMTLHGRGLICAAITQETAQRLHLAPMVANNTAAFATAFTVSIDAAHGITTGISAYDRAYTIQLLINATSSAHDFARPGHIFPLVAKEGGVLQRPGHTEAAVDLARLAGLAPAGVICEIINSDGTMARLPELLELAQKHAINIISIADLIAHRKKHEQRLVPIGPTQLPTQSGNFMLYVFEDSVLKSNAIVLIKEPLLKNTDALVRIHSECFTGDVLGSVRCDCAEQHKRALELIEQEGSGIFIYLRQEGRGIGLANKIRAYQLQDKGYDTVQANHLLGFKTDLRDYADAAEILKYFGASNIRLLTNSPHKISNLQNYGITVTQRIPLEIKARATNSAYLQTKKNKMGYLFS